MIDVISSKALRRLVEAHGTHCVSIYLPTHVAAETIQDPIRLKNLITRAERELRAAGLPAAEVDRMMAAASGLLRDRDFWAHQARGLAVFVTPDETVAYRLPENVDELVVVADRLHLKPLLPSVASGDVFYVLALSQNQIRLLRGSRYSVDQLPLDGIPGRLADALSFDDREAQLQSHSADRTGTGQVAAAFHGQGGGKDARGADIDRFLNAVDTGVCRLLGVNDVPLVLAGVTDIVARYRRVSGYPHLVADHIAGNPERASVEELHDRAWPLVSPLLDAARHDARARILGGTGPTSTAMDEVVLAAHDGRVRSLFVQIGVQRWGRFDAEQRRVEPHDVRQPGDRDLLDVATIDTLLADGRVFAVERQDLPDDDPIVAEFRY